MEHFFEFIVYGLTFLLCVLVVGGYLLWQRHASKVVEKKIELAKQAGSYEPVSLHPVVDQGSCIRSGACIAACPEKDILGIRNGKATTINASHCVGHGACFTACPTQAITLCIGTEKRGVDLPHVDRNFESNIQGVYIAGELGGMGLIKNAVEQGKQAVDHIARSINRKHDAKFDLAIVGAGPAGIAAALNAKKHGLNFIILEQDTLGGAVLTFPRAKIVMTSAMDLPLHGKVKLSETSKQELLQLWHEVLDKNGIQVLENTKVEEVQRKQDHFVLSTLQGEPFTSKTVMIAIGRRGTPRKLGIEGENLEKVAYRLLEPELISGKNILIVGGGDSAIESALLLSDQNKVTISYRSDKFSRLKPKNDESVKQAMAGGRVKILFNTAPKIIKQEFVVLTEANSENELTIDNDLVYIFAGGELPTQFLQKTGIQVSTKFGEAILSHS